MLRAPTQYQELKTQSENLRKQIGSELDEFRMRVHSELEQLAAFRKELEQLRHFGRDLEERITRALKNLEPLSGFGRDLEAGITRKLEKLERIAEVRLEGLIASELRPSDLSGLGERIDWDLAPQSLQAGDLSTLNPSVVQTIRDTAKIAEVIALARQLGVDPTVLVVGLIARAEAVRNRSAARIAKAIFGNTPSVELDAISRVLHIV